MLHFSNRWSNNVIEKINTYAFPYFLIQCLHSSNFLLLIRITFNFEETNSIGKLASENNHDSEIKLINHCGNL